MSERRWWGKMWLHAHMLSETTIMELSGSLRLMQLRREGSAWNWLSVEHVAVCETTVYCRHPSWLNEICPTTVYKTVRTHSLYFCWDNGLTSISHPRNLRKSWRLSWMSRSHETKLLMSLNSLRSLKRSRNHIILHDRRKCRRRDEEMEGWMCTEILWCLWRQGWKDGGKELRKLRHDAGKGRDMTWILLGGAVGAGGMLKMSEIPGFDDVAGWVTWGGLLVSGELVSSLEETFQQQKIVWVRGIELNTEIVHDELDCLEAQMQLWQSVFFRVLIGLWHQLPAAMEDPPDEILELKRLTWCPGLWSGASHLHVSVLQPLGLLFIWVTYLVLACVSSRILPGQTLSLPASLYSPSGRISPLWLPVPVTRWSLTFTLTWKQSYVLMESPSGHSEILTCWLLLSSVQVPSWMPVRRKGHY